MNILREIQKAVEKYEILLQENQEEAKERKNEYLKCIEAAKQDLNECIDRNAKEYQIWSERLVEVFEKKDDKLYLKIEKKIDMAVISSYLNRISIDLFKAGLLQERLLKIEQRFIQYSIL